MPNRKEMLVTIVLVAVGAALYFHVLKPYLDKYVGTMKA